MGLGSGEKLAREYENETEMVHGVRAHVHDFKVVEAVVDGFQQALWEDVLHRFLEQLVFQGLHRV